MKLEDKTFELILKAMSAIVLRFVPIYFGYVGKATEMGLMIVAL
ncbi:hypothetical protein [Vibrio gazogenes]|nr:hypothetical protein [Vibrio gazogenes]